MTYPGLVLLVGVGIGLATFLYYVFNENREEGQQHSYSRNGRPPEDRSYEDRSWSISSHKAEKYPSYTRIYVLLLAFDIII